MSLIKRVDHVSIAVHDIPTAERFLVGILGAHPNTPQTLDGDGEFFWADYYLAGFKLELVQPRDPKRGDIARYLDKYGEGLHHVSLEVDDIHDAVEYFEERGQRVVQQNIEKETGWRDAFLSPRTSHGVLFQLWDHIEDKAG